MNWTKFLIATLIGGIAYFFSGWLVYGLLLNDLMAAPPDLAQVVTYPEEEFKIGYMALSCLVWGALLAFIFMRWANISTFMGGLKGGAILAALISLSVGLGLASQYKVWSIQTTLADVIGGAITTGLAGGLIGWYLGRK